MASRRVLGNRLELRAYAGIDPATGKQDYVRDTVPADWVVWDPEAKKWVGAPGKKREFDRIVDRVDARAAELAEARRQRRRDPAGPKPKPRPKADRTVGDAVEAWWKAHGSKLAAAPKTRPLIDGIILPNLGDVKVALTAGTPPDDDDERDPDVVYLAERWAAIAAGDRKGRDGKPVAARPLKPSVIHRCHGIVGAALRRAGHPIPDPGLPPMEEGESTTPLPEEMADFLPHLAAERTAKGYTVTRRVRGSDKTVSYTVAGQPLEPTAMDLMLEAFALLVAAGPRPVEAAAIARNQLDLATGRLSLDGRGVVLAYDDQGREQWVIRHGETAKRRQRTIKLDARALAAARRWLDWQKEYALRLGARPGPRALLFSLAAEATEPISPKVFSKAFERAVDRAVAAGVALPDGFHLYDMRHFGITQMLRLGHGRNVAAVAKRFGTSIRMIQQRYEHAVPSDDDALADTMSALWGDAPSPAVVVPLR